MPLTIDLTGRRALVTGASSGIGAELCRVLVGCGASVAMLARRKERLDALAGELGHRATPIPVDVTELPALEAAVAEAADWLGGIDAVVAVAGQNITGAMTSGDPALWRQLMDVNLIGPLATVRYAADHFAEAGRRDVVLIGSTGGVDPMPGLGIYGASKRGLRAAADSVRLELAHRGVGVSIVIPGLFATEGSRGDIIHRDGEPVPMGVDVFVPSSGPPPPAPVAQTIAYLLSLADGVSIHELVIRPTGNLRP